MVINGFLIHQQHVQISLRPSYQLTATTNQSHKVIDAFVLSGVREINSCWEKMKRAALFVLSFPFSQWYDGMLEKKKKKQSERHKLQGQYIIGNPMEYLLKTDGRARPQPIFPVTFNQPISDISKPWILSSRICWEIWWTMSSASPSWPPTGSNIKIDSSWTQSHTSSDEFQIQSNYTNCWKNCCTISATIYNHL